MPLAYSTECTTTVTASRSTEGETKSPSSVSRYAMPKDSARTFCVALRMVYARSLTVPPTNFNEPLCPSKFNDPMIGDRRDKNAVEMVICWGHFFHAVNEPSSFRTFSDAFYRVDPNGSLRWLKVKRSSLSYSVIADHSYRLYIHDHEALDINLREKDGLTAFLLPSAGSSYVR